MGRAAVPPLVFDHFQLDDLAVLGGCCECFGFCHGSENSNPICCGSEKSYVEVVFYPIFSHFVFLLDVCGVGVSYALIISRGIE